MRTMILRGMAPALVPAANRDACLTVALSRVSGTLADAAWPSAKTAAARYCRQTMPGEAFLDQAAHVLQARGDGAFGTAEQLGGLLAGFVFEIAEDQRSTVFFREPADFLIEKSQPLGFGLGALAGHVLQLHLSAAAAFCHGVRFQGGTIGHAVEPGADALARHDRVPLADEDEEGGLEGIVGVVDIAEHAPADAQDHGAVNADQGAEGRLFAQVEIALEQGAVGEPAAVGQGHLDQAPHHTGQPATRHATSSQAGVIPYLYLPAPGQTDVLSFWRASRS